MWQEQTLIGWNLKAYSNHRKLSDLQSSVNSLYWRQVLWGVRPCCWFFFLKRGLGMARQRWAVGYRLLSWVRLSEFFSPPLGSQGKRTTSSAVEYVARQKQNVMFPCKTAKKWEAEVACGARHTEHKDKINVKSGRWPLVLHHTWIINRNWDK